MMTSLALGFPVIDPVAFYLGPVPVRWYGISYAAGLLLGWYVARRLVARPDPWGRTPPTDAAGLDDLLLYVAAGVVLGGRLVSVLVYNLPYYLEHPLEALMIWRGGMSFHGGLTGAAFGMWLFARKRGIPVLPVFDLVASVVPIGLFFGRIANFINGELWGRPTDISWAVVFPDAGPEPRHPSQLYEAAFEGLVLFLVLQAAIRLGAFRRPGLVTGLFGAGYATARIGCEFFREPDVQLGFIAGSLTMGMLLSVPMFLIGAALIARACNKHDTP